MNEKPSILVFIDWYYPGFKAGGPVRSCLNMVAHLNQDFNFYIVTGNTEYTETTPYENMNFNQWVDGPQNEKVIYLDQKNRNLQFYISLMEERKYNAIMIMGLFSKNFSILPLKAANKISFEKIIVSPRGMLAEGALKIKSLKKKMFLAWADFTGFYRSVIFHVSNQNEAEQVKGKIKRYGKIIIADNFPRIIKQDLIIGSTKEAGKLKLVSVARIAPEKNTLFAIQILQGCQSDVELDLFGPVYDEAYWKECQAMIQKLPANIKVVYKNNLPSESLFEILPGYDFLFLPTRGENFGHIILESFMCGLPVIVSDKTPWKNLAEKKIGFDIPLENVTEFEKCLNKTAGWDAGELMIWKNNAFAFGKEKTKVSVLKDIYKKLLQ